MPATMIRVRSVLAAFVCVFGLAFLLPAAANAQVTVTGIRVTLRPVAGGSGQTAVYCDTTSTCPAGGITVWDLGGGVTLNGGETLVLSQTGTVTNGGGIGSNFDTSDRVQAPPLLFTDDCDPGPVHACGVKIELNFGSGLTTVYDSDASIALVAFNHTPPTDTCEGSNYSAPLSLIGSPANYTLRVGYADNAHGCPNAANPTTFPNPFNGAFGTTAATRFFASGVSIPFSIGCGTNCYDAGVILITGITVTQGCTYTQGWYKNRGNDTVTGLTLGTVVYSADEIKSILANSAVKGNGLLSLAHQLITAKLNVASGASTPASVATAIAQADALIGSLKVPPVGTDSLTTAQTSSLVDILSNFNEGTTGPGHCQ